MKAVLIAILLSAGSFQFDFSECETLPGTTKEPTSVAHKPESPNSSWYFENQHLNSAIKTPLGFEAIIIVNHGADPIIKNTIVKRKERSKIQSSTVLIQEEFEYAYLESESITCQIDDNFIYLIKPLLTWGELCQVDKRQESKTAQSITRISRFSINKEKKFSGSISSLSKLFEESKSLEGYLHWNYKLMKVSDIEFAMQRDFPNRLTMTQINFMKKYGKKKGDPVPYVYGCIWDGKFVYVGTDLAEKKIFQEDFVKNLMTKSEAERASLYAQITDKMAQVAEAGYSINNFGEYTFRLDNEGEPYLNYISQLTTFEVPMPDFRVIDITSPYTRKGEPVEPVTDIHATAGAILALELGKHYCTLYLDKEPFGSKSFWSEFRDSPLAEREEKFKEYFSSKLEQSWGQLDLEQKDSTQMNLTTLLWTVLLLKKSEVSLRTITEALKNIAKAKGGSGRLMV